MNVLVQRRLHSAELLLQGTVSGTQHARRAQLEGTCLLLYQALQCILETLHGHKNGSHQARPFCITLSDWLQCNQNHPFYYQLEQAQWARDLEALCSSLYQEQTKSAISTTRISLTSRSLTSIITAMKQFIASLAQQRYEC